MQTTFQKSFRPLSFLKSGAFGWYLLLLVPGITVLRCAYFNTYYNAEITFKEAYAAHKKIMRNYPDSIVVDPPADIRTKYERVIEKTIKVIDIYPKEIKWHDDAVFLMGKAYFYKKDMAKAIRRFKDLQQEYPASPFIPESKMLMGKAYIEEGNYTRAEEILQEVLANHAYLDKDEQITLLLVEIAIRREGKAQAIGLLEKIRKSVKSEEKKLDIVLRVSELYVELKQFDKAIALLEKAPRKKDLPFHSYRLDMALLTCYLSGDSPQKALAHAEKMLRDKLYREHVSELLLQKGIILRTMGRTDDAMVIFKRLIAEEDSTAVDSLNVRSKANYELALLYQHTKGDFVEAKKYLGKASASRDTAVAPKASRRLAAMDTLEKLRAMPDTATKTIGTLHFRIGEIFRFDLFEPESAYASFLYVARDTNSLEELVPKSIFAAASIARTELKDTARSDSLLNVVVEKYAMTDYALRAQRELDVPATRSLKETAQDAYRNAEIKYLDGDIKGAVQAFYSIYKDHPHLDIAPKSLYAAAWLSDNELQKNKTAKELYEKLCEKYPESDYCIKEARPRIKVVMDTLDALKQQQKNAESSTATSAPGKKPGQKTATKQVKTVAVTASEPPVIDTVQRADSVKSDFPGISEAPDSAGPVQTNDSTGVQAQDSALQNRP
jgi:tetratricopeptide (TPR) repeat protein